MDKKTYWIIGIVVVVIIGFFIIKGSMTGNVVREYCGDNVCNSGENKCTCSSDCGNCYETQGCSQYSCDSNNQCAPSYTLDNCCGNGKCEVNENCASCSSDCGQCSRITSSSDAIQKLKSRTDIVSEWETLAKNRNCGARYLDLSNAAYFVARITVSQNLIECNQWNSFWDITKLTDFQNKEMNDKMKNCDKSLIELYNKAVRGYDSSRWTAPLEETCDNCDDFYAIHLGCIDADVDVSQINNDNTPSSPGVSIYTPSQATAFVVVDAKTGAVYW
ncbi:MAG: hypothetical protein WC402_03035 [Candidatus Pacearchaeota archaeon]|jgi:hypothetical protein